MSRLSEPETKVNDIARVHQPILYIMLEPLDTMLKPFRHQTKRHPPFVLTLTSRCVRVLTRVANVFTRITQPSVLYDPLYNFSEGLLDDLSLCSLGLKRVRNGLQLFDATNDTDCKILDVALEDLCLWVVLFVHVQNFGVR